MANITVLERDTGDLWRVVMHFSVATGNNSAGVPWQESLVKSGIGGNTILPDGDGTKGTISTADKALIESGALLEHVESVRLGGGDVQAAAKEIYNSRKSSMTAQTQARLSQYGRNLEVV